MAVPFRRTSKTKKRMRRTHLKKTVAELAKCPKCSATIQPHRVCMECGNYKGKDVLNKEEVVETPEVETKAKAKKEKKEKK